MALGVLAREGRVDRVDGGEFRVAADVVEVGVRVEHDDRKGSETPDDGADFADAEAGVEQEGALVAEDEIGEDLLILARLVEGVDAAGQLIDFEPAVGDVELFVVGEGGVFELGAEGLGRAELGEERGGDPQGGETEERCQGDGPVYKGCGMSSN